jgi:dihydroflavonol-4-reductase
VVHAAAKVHGSGAATEAAYERVNVDGTRNIVRASQEHGLGRLLFVSSTAALGGSPDPLRPATEETPDNVGTNDSPYADSKRRADALVLAARSDQLTTMVAYPGFIFGSHGSRYRGSEVIEGILSKRIAIITNGGLSVVHVEDVVVGLANALLNGRGGERYIMSGDNVSFAGIAETVMSMAGRRRPTLRLPNVARDLLGRALGHAARRRGDLPPLHLDPAFAYRFYSSDHARRSLGFTSRGFAEIVSDYLAFQRALQ